MTRPSRASPSARLAAIEPTPAIAMHAERDAGDEDVEAAQAAAQFAQREAQGQPTAIRLRASRCDGVQTLTVQLAPSMRPERSRTTRSQRAAERGVMGDQNQRGAALGVAGEQQIDDLPAGGLVEIAGRLVGDQDRRAGRQRAGERHALLLAARQLGRIMAAAARQARPPQARRARARAASATPASSSGTATFSSAVMVGIRWNDWNTMPTLRPRKRASASSSSAPKVLAGDRHRAGIGRSRPAMTISSVDLPDPEGPTRPTASPRPILRSMSLRI